MITNCLQFTRVITFFSLMLFYLNPIYFLTNRWKIFVEVIWEIIKIFFWHHNSKYRHYVSFFHLCVQTRTRRLRFWAMSHSAKSSKITVLFFAEISRIFSLVQGSSAPQFTNEWEVWWFHVWFINIKWTTESNSLAIDGY